jgi:hypothetical protein
MTIATTGTLLLGFEEYISGPALSALLYVGQPEQDELSPVPLQRPSPGQVPPECWVELASWFCAEDSRAGQAAGVSSDGEVWAMCQLGSAAVPSSVAVGWVMDVEEARVEPDRPRSGSVLHRCLKLEQCRQRRTGHH